MEPDTETSIDERELPAGLAEDFRIAMDLDEPPATLDDWVDETARHFADVGVSLDGDSLCLTESSRHEARVAEETYHFACVLDTLLVPFVLDEAPEVAVVSHSPESDADVEFLVTQEGVSAKPGNAVLSFGAASDVSPPDDRNDVLASGYETVCPYINAFPDEAEYESWDAATQEADTMVLSPDEGFSLGRRLIEEIAE